MTAEGEVDVDGTSCYECCASCGIAEIDDVKLVPCDGCDLVRYCGDECKGDHKSEHKEACKKRASELRDELLFKQPESTHHGDCPICFLPIPLDRRKYSIYTCCSKLICDGCVHANEKRAAERRLQHACPFCRKPTPTTDEEIYKRRMKRVEANDPFAICQKGAEEAKQGNHRGAFEYWTKASELGHALAQYGLSVLYRRGDGVEKDIGKEIHHLEEAAIGGHPDARHNLGVLESKNGNIERAVKHWIIAATQGGDESMKVLMKMFKDGFVSKEDLAATLRAHKAAVDATKSPQRKKAEEYYKYKYGN